VKISNLVQKVKTVKMKPGRRFYQIIPFWAKTDKIRLFQQQFFNWHPAVSADTMMVCSHLSDIREWQLIA
jgi:hypothetical protein